MSDMLVRVQRREPINCYFRVHSLKFKELASNKIIRSTGSEMGVRNFKVATYYNMRRIDMTKDEKLLALIYSSFTNETNSEITECYDSKKNWVTLRTPIRAMTDEMQSIMYAVVEYIEFDGDDKIVQ